MQPAEDIIQAGMWSLRNCGGGGGCRDRGQACTCVNVSIGANKHFCLVMAATHEDLFCSEAPLRSDSCFTPAEFWVLF